jgi:hypothetical protein
VHWQGLLASIGAILGHIGGSISNGIIVGPEGAMQLVRRMGLSGASGDFSSVYWISLVISTACFDLLNLGLMAGTGALVDCTVSNST